MYLPPVSLALRTPRTMKKFFVVLEVSLRRCQHVSPPWHDLSEMNDGCAVYTFGNYQECTSENVRDVAKSTASKKQKEVGCY